MKLNFAAPAGAWVLLTLLSGCQPRPAQTPRADGIVDTDGDAILDAKDACPSENERPNGHNDHDGCPDKKVRKRGLFVPGIVVTSLSAPLIGMGAQFTAWGVGGCGEPDPMTCGFEKVGIPLLVAAGVHLAVGIPLIVAGAETRWSDEPQDPEAPALQPHIGAEGVGFAF
jgi:hypothetical protein